MISLPRSALCLASLFIPGLAAVAGAQTTEEEPEPAARVYYDRGFVAESADGDFQLKTGLRSQMRYEVVRPDGDDAEWQSRFYIPRLRGQFEGHAFGKANTYKIEFEFTGRGNTGLKDFFIDHKFAPGVQFRVGQWKKPFARHELTSDFSSDFNERSIANGLVDIGRDLGAMLHNGYDKSPEGLEWAIGVFNGQGDADRPRQTISCEDPADVESCTVGAPTNVPADWGPIVAARVGFNVGDVKGYAEGDLDGGPLRLAIGASYQIDLNNLEEDAAGDPLLEHGAVLDALVKVAGADIQGAVYLLKIGEADAEFSYFGQAGFFLVPKRWQLCARYSLLPTLGTEDDKSQEILGAFNWYFNGHNFKWATDAGVIITSEGDTDTQDVQIRTMLQLVL